MSREEVRRKGEGRGGLEGWQEEGEEGRGKLREGMLVGRVRKGETRVETHGIC